MPLDPHAGRLPGPERLIDVPATLSSGEIVLWDDGYQRGGHYDAKGTR